MEPEKQYRDLGFMRDWTENDERWEIHENAIESGKKFRIRAMSEGVLRLICPEEKWFCTVTKNLNNQ